MSPLQVDQDLRAERREWRTERIGWVAMLALVVAALAGLLGTGPLSHADAGDDRLRVAYERTIRRQAPARLKVQLPAGAAEGAEAWLWIDRAYADAVAIQKITPAPLAVEAAGDRLGYRLALDPSRSTVVELALEPEAMGAQRARLWLDGEPPVSFDQRILP